MVLRYVHILWVAFLSAYFILTQINPEKELRSKITTMRACGYFLLLINIVVSSMMFILIYGNTIIKHHEITVITLATYTFSSLSFAIKSSLKQLKQNNNVYSCAKIISLTSASVSLATLTNTMLATFGEDNLLLRSIVLPILCGAITIFIIVSAFLMVYKATLDLRKLKNEKE